MYVLFLLENKLIVLVEGTVTFQEHAWHWSLNHNNYTCNIMSLLGKIHGIVRQIKNRHNKESTEPNKNRYEK